MFIYNIIQYQNAANWCQISMNNFMVCVSHYSTDGCYVIKNFLCLSYGTYASLWLQFIAVV